MINARVVVDGSNIATEGRTLPSLQQLDDAVRSFLDEFPDAEVTVVVDATFGHRIEEGEKVAYEEALLAGELISPPAGAIGRGDAFVLSIANRAEATVFSNDSFQEFHGDYTWLFDEGRLIGGKPVPGIGWVFVLRSPVRGPLSRRSTREARGSVVKKTAPERRPAARTRKGSTRSPDAVAPEDAPGEPAARGPSRSSGRVPQPSVNKRDRSPAATIADDDPSSPAADGKGRTRRRRVTGQPQAMVNEPLPFLEFVTAHPVGSSVEGVVDRFSSHGAYVIIGSAQCYLSLKSMADPPPKSAKEVLTVGETRSFAVLAFDPPRRSIDLAIPGVEPVVAATAADGSSEAPTPAEEAPTMAATKKAAVKKRAARAPAKKSTARKTTAKKTTAKKTAAKKTTAKKTTAKKTAAKKSIAKKSTAKKTTAKKTAAKKTTAKKTTAKKTAPARKAAAKKTTAKKSAAKRTPAKRTAARKSS